MIVMRVWLRVEWPPRTAYASAGDRPEEPVYTVRRVAAGEWVAECNQEPINDADGKQVRWPSLEDALLHCEQLGEYPL